MTTDNFPPPKTGLARLVSAFRNSLSGFAFAWKEAAFRQECVMALALVPAAFWVGQGWVETALLISLVVLVMAVEILNSAIEAVVDRFGPDWNIYAKAAKDMGSAAVLLCLVLCGAIWAWALWRKLAI